MCVCVGGGGGERVTWLLGFSGSMLAKTKLRACARACVDQRDVMVMRCDEREILLYYYKGRIYKYTNQSCDRATMFQWQT